MSTQSFVIPARKDILSDFRKWAKFGGAEDQAIRVVRRWFNCGYDLNELPLLLKGLTPEIIRRGLSEASHEARAAALSSKAR